MAERFSRRGLLGAAGAGAAGVAAGIGLDRLDSPDTRAASDRGPADPRLERADAVVGSRSRLQPGIAGPVPAFGDVLAIDLGEEARRTGRSARAAAAGLLRQWTSLAQAAEQGRISVPAGVAAGDLQPASLQFTIGLGASLLEACELTGRRPPAWVDLPHFAGDRLEPSRSGGDFVVQVCAEDPMKMAGAVQAVAATLGSRARLRWSQAGFRQTAASSLRPDQTTRNLMGHRDGTDNPSLGSPLWDATVVTRQPEAAYSWMDQGSFLVARRIRIELAAWFAEDVAARDRVIGRRTSDGGPLSGGSEHRPVDLDARNEAGELAIPAHAHIRLASTRDTAGARIYRRGFSYDDGWASGERDAGLMFLAWQADPRRGFVPIQQALTDGHDALSRFIVHTGSAVLAVPPAPEAGEYVGQRLFES